MNEVDCLGSQPFEGCRIFRLDLNKMLLKSLNHGKQNKPWLPGEIQVSRCDHLQYNNAAVTHGVLTDLKPVKDCTCGIWSCKSRKIMEKTYPPQMMQRDRSQWLFRSNFNDYTIYARIQQWGVVIEHQNGYRSEFARIIPESITFYPRQNKSSHNKKLISYLRQKYLGN